MIEQAGMLVEGATLFERPSLQKEGTTIVDWINMFIQTPFIGIDADTRQQIFDETVELTKPLLLTERGWMVDYVRLRVKARKL